MRLSKYLYKTTKETPSDAELKSHQILIRGGYIKQVSSGIFSYMPIALRVLKKIENIIREEMNKIEGQEVNLPVVMPASMWMETNRYEEVGSEMLRFTDRVGRKMLLGMTHEEAATDLVRNVINSYKQLPITIYQFQTKFRDEARARGGLIRVREFVMKDAYSFHTNEEDLNAYYEECFKAYEKIYHRCGLPVISVSSDVGMMGGAGADEFMALTDKGEDSLIICESCGYRANREVAQTKRNYIKEDLLAMEKIATPGKSSIQEVAEFLGVPESSTVKSIVLVNEEDEFFLCLIRGDLDINETKLKNFTKSKALTFATDAQLEAHNMVPGYIGPQGINSVRIIADESVAESTNLVAGANEAGYHIKNVNFGRDFSAHSVVDIANVGEGDSCVECGKPLKVQRGIEVGNIFKLGTKYSKAMGATYVGEDGKTKDMVMGCYGIGLGRLMASVLELGEKEKEIIWPMSITPFEVEIIGVALEKSEEAKNVAEGLYKDLQNEGLEVLFDDRKASPGFKFKDSELIGAPIKLVVGDKALAKGGVEVSVAGKEKEIVPVDQMMAFIQKAKKELLEALRA